MVIAILTVIFVPARGFVVGDGAAIDWRSGAKVGGARGHITAMKALQSDAESACAADDVADDVSM